MVCSRCYKGLGIWVVLIGEPQATEKIQGPLQEDHPLFASVSPSYGGSERLTSITSVPAPCSTLGILPEWGKAAADPVPPEPHGWYHWC